MVLQQCAFKTISLTVVEKQFESQSYFTYAEEIFTIGMYGRCIHPYFDCFWISHYMNFNNFLNNATNSSVLKGLKKQKKIFRHSWKDNRVIPWELQKGDYSSKISTRTNNLLAFGNCRYNVKGTFYSYLWFCLLKHYGIRITKYHVNNTKHH